MIAFFEEEFSNGFPMFGREERVNTSLRLESKRRRAHISDYGSAITAWYFTLAAGVLLTGTGRITMLIGLFFILLVMWVMGFFAFHVAGALIHLLLLFALISLVMHLFTTRAV